MTQTEFRAARSTLGLSVRTIARMTHWSPGAAQRWEDGTAAVPEPVAAWLNRRASDMAADPPPQKVA